MGVPGSRVEEVTRALEAMDDMIWSEGVAERVARVALAADAVEGDRPELDVPLRRDEPDREMVRELDGGGVEPSREAEAMAEALNGDLTRIARERDAAEARVGELEAALRETRPVLARLLRGAGWGDHDLLARIDAALAAAGEGEDRTPTREEERLRTLLVHFRNRLAANGLDERMIGEMDAALSFDPRRSGSRLPEQEA